MSNYSNMFCPNMKGIPVFWQSWTVGKSWSRFWGNPMWAQQCCNMRSSVFPFFEHSLRPAWPFRIGWREHLPESIRTCLVDRSFKQWCETCHPKRPYRNSERFLNAPLSGESWEMTSQVHQQNSSWIQGTLAWKMSRGNDQRTLKSSTMSLMAWWGRQFLPLGRC